MANIDSLAMKIDQFVFDTCTYEYRNEFDSRQDGREYMRETVLSNPALVSEYIRDWFDYLPDGDDYLPTYGPIAEDILQDLAELMEGQNNG